MKSKWQRTESQQCGYLVVEQAKDLGILCYMAKPFDLFELRERVKEILNSSGIST